MIPIATIAQWIIGFVLVVSSLGVILSRNPVHASLCFLMTLLMLAALYLDLSAQFIGVMQVLVYAGAILVLFMFVIVLFQDAHYQIEKYPARSSTLLLLASALAFMLTLIFFGRRIIGLKISKDNLAENYGSVESLGKALYLDFFFPFEAVILIFLVAIVGSLYIGRKVR